MLVTVDLQPSAWVARKVIVIVIVIEIEIVTVDLQPHNFRQITASVVVRKVIGGGTGQLARWLQKKWYYH